MMGLLQPTLEGLHGRNSQAFASIFSFINHWLDTRVISVSVWSFDYAPFEPNCLFLAYNLFTSSQNPHYLSSRRPNRTLDLRLVDVKVACIATVL